METLISLLAGVSLSAATGFRLFVPFLVMSIATATGHMTPAQGFEWIGSPVAITAFAVATGVEIAGYYIPWVDEILDLITTPAALVAGAVLTASTLVDISPFLQWTLAIIAGAGAAGLTKGMTDVARLTSTATTGGIANPALSTMELFTSSVISVMAILIPLLTGIVILGLLCFAAYKVLRFFGRRRRRFR